ncbi:MAG: AAA family ATPase [Candidatus Diapherotrites archaeon]|uniref:AAA family ATPase n=1 Tax=Candidatus Iainarchaeum sp. TaxID=3101447 RepID=A0A938YQD2_9ARCH|nr:AAA family ATPase [Candidatus Diapherotrites archaeon]
MRIIITGSPGTGKTTVAKALGKSTGHKVLNEKQFAMEKGIGKWDAEENELVIPLQAFASEVNKLLERESKVILEGHLLCELRLKADFVVVIRVHPEVLEARLEGRGYKADKVQDNVFCEGIDYCKKHALRNYGNEKVVEVQCGKSIKETKGNIIRGLKERGAKI